MATVTAYDSEISQWQNKLELATSTEEISEAKARLFFLSVTRWNSVTDLGDLSAEIDSRMLAYKSENDNQGIYKASYQKWIDTFKKGIDEDSFKAARNLLVQSDQTVFERLAQKRKDQLPTVVQPGETSDIVLPDGTAVPVAGTANTVNKNSNGTYSLTTNSTPATVKSDAVTDAQAKTQKQDPNYLDRRPAWIDTNIEYHRKKTAEGLAVDSAYIKRYYSVIDAEVYFGNEYVEDIHDISWSVRQNVTPLFGYNSYTYDEVARGNRIIVGNFTINFTSPNYLFSILEEANKANVISITNMTTYTVPKLSSSVTPSLRGATMGSRERGHHANIWPQTFDIDIIFGEKTGTGDPVHILLLGCALQHCNMVLSASATSSPPAVMEQYSFIAQDIRTVVVGKNDQTASDISSDSSNAKNSNSAGSTASSTQPKTNSTDFVDVDSSNVNSSDNSNDNQDADTSKKDSNSDKNTSAEEEKNIADARAQLKDAVTTAHVILSNGDSEGDIDASFTKDTGKLVSDQRTCELLARFSKLFPDQDHILTASEQKELAKGVKAAEAKGEYFLVDSDVESLTAYRYRLTHDGEVKMCTSVMDTDGVILNALSKGKYHILTQKQMKDLYFNRA